ncbi:MAG: beta-ketoacyl synthase N-terminal-like domain-containing protein, partial [Desulfosalsimonas sp.]
LNDAGITPCGPECAKGSFILGRGSYITAGAHNLVQRSLIAEQTASIVREMVPGFTEDQASELKSDLVTRLMPFGSEAAPSVMPNISAGRVANRLGLMGPNYTIDAACASSLFALDAAARDLASGRSDLALAGGVHIFNNVAFLNVFCALGAMSRQDRICPFDSKADGLLPGEGAGIVVLKRLSDAERDGSRIYAVISGIGTSSDGRSTGVAAPAVDGEVLALERAYRAAGVETRTVELLEAHGTATAAGDAAEIESLRRVFGEKGENEPRTCALGSVKSMIGHAMPAAGIAGFIKAAMSLYHRILPPTINCETPNPEFGLDQTPFYISTETRPWFKTSHDVPRRAGVNAFGFGGVNAHVVLEQYGSKGSLPDGAADIRMPAENPGDSLRWDAALFLFSSETRDGLAEKCTKTAESIENQGRACVFALCEKILSSYVAGRHRLAVVAGSAGDLAKKLRQASARLSEPERSRIKDAKGIYYFSSPLGKTGKTAFMFPGEGSSYTNMMMDLCLYFPAVRRSFERINCAVTSRYENRTFPATRFVFPAAMLTEDEKKALEAEFWKVDSGLQAILASSLAVNELLSGFGVVPDMIAGHSAGEYSAWIASGILDTDDFHQKQEDIARVYAESGSQRIQTSMTAVSAGRKKVEPLVEQIEGEIHISNDNCPHQVVVVGEAGAMERFRERLKSEKIFYTDLPSGEVHHTPLAADQEKPLYKAFSGLDIRTPETTVYSAVSAGPYPENKDEILDLMVGYWLRPLAFRQTVEKMYEDGARIFVEVGPGNNLCGFVDDTLRGKPVMTAASNTPRRSGPAQFCHVLAMLAAQHVPVLVEPMIAAAGKMARFPDKSGQGSRSRKPSKTAVNMDLALPELGLAKDAAVKWREKISAGQQPRNSSPAQKEPGGIEEAGGSGPMHRYLETMSRFLDLQKQVAELASGAGRQGGN